MANSPFRLSIPIEEEYIDSFLPELLQPEFLPTQSIELFQIDGQRKIYKLFELVTPTVLQTSVGYAWLNAVSTDSQKATLYQLLYKGFATEDNGLNVIRNFFRAKLTSEQSDFSAAYLWLESAKEMSYSCGLGLLNAMLDVCLELLLEGDTKSFTGLFLATRQMRRSSFMTSKIENFYLLPILLKALSQKMQETQSEPLPWLQEFCADTSESQLSAILSELLTSLYLPKAWKRWRMGKILLVALAGYGHQLAENNLGSLLVNLLKRWRLGEFTLNDMEITQILRVAVKAGNLIAFQLFWEYQFQPQIIFRPTRIEEKTPAVIFSYAIHEGVQSGNLSLVSYLLYNKKTIEGATTIEGSAFGRGLVDVNAVHPILGTALHVIAKKLMTHPEKREALLAVAQQLCSLGASLWIKDRNDKTPLDIYPDFYQYSLAGLHDLGYQVAFGFSFPHNYLVLFSWIKGAILAGKLASMFGGIEVQCMIGGRPYSRKITEGSLWIFNFLENFAHYGFLRATPAIKKMFDNKLEILNRLRRRAELSAFYEKFLELLEQRPHSEKTCLYPPLISVERSFDSLPRSFDPTSSALAGSSVDFTFFESSFSLSQLVVSVDYLLELAVRPTLPLFLLPEEKATSVVELVRDLGLLESPARVVRWLEALYQQGLKKCALHRNREETFIKSEKNKNPFKQLFNEQTAIFILDQAIKDSKDGAIKSIYIYLEVEMSAYMEDDFQRALQKALLGDKEDRLLYELVQYFKQMIFTNAMIRTKSLLPSNTKIVFPRLNCLFFSALDSICQVNKFEPSTRLNLLRIACYYNRVDLFSNIMQEWDELSTINFSERSELLLLAVQRGSTDMVSSLLASKLSYDLSTLYQIEENSVMTLLNVAVSQRQVKVVRLLLANNADVNQVDSVFGTALHLVVKNICDPTQGPFLQHWLKIASILCEYGAILSIEHQSVSAYALIKAQYKQARYNSQLASSGSVMGPPPRTPRGLLDTEEQMRKGYDFFKRLKHTRLLQDAESKARENHSSLFFRDVMDELVNADLDCDRPQASDSDREHSREAIAAERSTPVYLSLSTSH